MSEERIDSDLERAVDEFQQYLSDLVPPLIVADSIEILMKYPPDLVASNINSWASSQLRSSRQIPLSDYFFHAVKKIHIVGEYNLVNREELKEYLEKLKPHLLSLCPVGDRETFRESLNRIDDSPASLASPVEIVYRQSGGQTPGPVASPEAFKETDIQRLDLLMKRIERELRLLSATGEPTSGDRRQEVVSEALAQAARSARMTVELERTLEHFRGLGINAGTEDVFRALGRNLPEWSLAAKPDLPVPEDSNLRAMRRIVAQAQDPKEGATRFHQMVQTAVERFNEGHLPQAVSMIGLAEKIIAAKEVDEMVSLNLRRRGHENLDMERLRKYAEAPEHHLFLRKILNFFEAFTPPGLLESLRREPKRDRRRLFLALLESHGETTRAAALENLRPPLTANAADEEIYFRRNLLYLLRRIPPGTAEPPQELVEIVSRHADLIFSPLLLKEAVAYLGQLKHPKSEEVLVTLLEDIESMLLGSGEPPDSGELLQLLDRIAASLARLGTPAARKALVDHALKKKPKLGNTMNRLTELSGQDLSDDEDTVERLLSALKANLPKKLLGFVIQKKDEDLKSIVEALSGTSLPKVKAALEDVAQQFPDSPAGQMAAKTIANRDQTPFAKKATESSMISLMGDLALFGLPALLQSLSDNAVTGTLTLEDPGGEVFGMITIEKGWFHSCQAGKLSGESAFYQLFERPQPGTFQLARLQQVGKDTHSLREILPLLMESVRRYDELQQAEVIVPDDLRLIAQTAQPAPLPDERDGLLFRELWNAVCKGATPQECEALVAVDAYRVRRLLLHWFETGSVQAAT